MLTFFPILQHEKGFWAARAALAQAVVIAVHEEDASVGLGEAVALAKLDTEADLDEVLNGRVERSTAAEQQLQVASGGGGHFAKDQGVQDGGGEPLGQPVSLVVHAPLEKRLESWTCDEIPISGPCCKFFVKATFTNVVPQIDYHQVRSIRSAKSPCFDFDISHVFNMSVEYTYLIFENWAE